MSQAVETLTISAFLLARIAEDEAVANAATGLSWSSVVDTPDDNDHAGAIYADGNWDAWVANWDGGSENGAHIARHDPARILAECAAKRAIVSHLAPALHAAEQAERAWVQRPNDPDVARWEGMKTAVRQAVECIVWHLAEVYSDHPDFNDDWCPL